MRVRQAIILVMAAASAMFIGCRAVDPDNKKKDRPGDPDVPSEVKYGIPYCKDGWDIYIAGTYRYGPSIIINDDGSIDAWFAASGDYHGKERMLLNTIVDHNYAYPVMNGDAGQYFRIEKDFYTIQLWCPTWNSTEESMTLSLYKWKGNYGTTVGNEPIFRKRYERFANNGWLSLYWNEDAESDHSIKIPAGEYLWVASEPTAQAGIWAQAGSSDSRGGLNPVSFSNGLEMNNFQFESRVQLDYTSCDMYWDQISYRHSNDGGKTWTADDFTLKPTEFSKDALSCCDPGVARWGGYYYLGYTSTEDPHGTENNVYVARSKNPDGPWEKWNGNGWGGNPEPVILYHGFGNPDKFGAGEPCFVVLDNTVYLYYSWYDSGVQTRVSTAPADDENWPAHLEYRGVAIDKSDPDIQSADHSDVKYRPDLKRFIAINTAKRMTEEAYIQIWSSDNGLKFNLENGLTGKGLKKGLHNCGWSSDEKGHQDPARPQYISYAYGIGTWGIWNTWFAPLEYKVYKQ